MKDFEDVRRTLDALRELAPYTSGVKAYKRRLDLVDMLYGDLKLSGSRLTREGAVSILEGNMIPGIPFAEHRLAEAHRRLLHLFEDWMSRMLDMDALLLGECAKALSGQTLIPYREGAPMLYHLDFIPGDPEDISGELTRRFRAIAVEPRAAADPCFRAAALHLAVLLVYPYAEGISESAARMAMQYTLCRAGMFPVDLELDEPEYHGICARCLKIRDPEAFAQAVRRAVFRKAHKLIDAVKRGV